MKNELKRCPFCGEPATMKYDRGVGWFVGCDGKFGSICPGYVWKEAPVFFERDHAEKAWNRRADDGETVV